MKFTLTTLVLILCFSSCKEKTERKTESNKLKAEPIEEIDLSKIPDSLEIIAKTIIVGDFNGDNKTDFASFVKNIKNKKTGIIIIHNAKPQKNYVFGAGSEINGISDLNWVENFETIPKGKIISSTLIDVNTGDIIGQDINQNFKLIGNGVSLRENESHGGGIIFWNGKEYKWFHVE